MPVLACRLAPLGLLAALVTLAACELPPLPPPSAPPTAGEAPSAEESEGTIRRRAAPRLLEVTATIVPAPAPSPSPKGGKASPAPARPGGGQRVALEATLLGTAGTIAWRATGGTLSATSGTSVTWTPAAVGPVELVATATGSDGCTAVATVKATVSQTGINLPPGANRSTSACAGGGATPAPAATATTGAGPIATATPGATATTDAGPGATAAPGTAATAAPSAAAGVVPFAWPSLAPGQFAAAQGADGRPIVLERATGLAWSPRRGLWLADGDGLRVLGATGFQPVPAESEVREAARVVAVGDEDVWALSRPKLAPGDPITRAPELWKVGSAGSAGRRLDALPSGYARAELALGFGEGALLVMGRPGNQGPWLQTFAAGEARVENPRISGSGAGATGELSVAFATRRGDVAYNEFSNAFGVADAENHVVRVVRTPVRRNGWIHSFGAWGVAGAADGRGEAARFDRPQAIAAWGADVWLVGEAGGRLRLAADGATTLVEGGASGAEQGEVSLARFGTVAALAVVRPAPETRLVAVADPVRKRLWLVNPR